MPKRPTLATGPLGGYLGKHPLKEAALFFLFHLLLWAALHPGLLMGQIWAGGDSLHQFWPYHDYTQNSLLQSKEIPWWNPHLFGGFPYFSNLQSAIFYWPRALLFWLPAEHGIGASLLLHGAWLGCGTSVFLRLRGCSLEASAAGAWLVLSGGFFSTHLYGGHVNFIEAGSWLPWVLIAWEFWVSQRSLRALAATAICLATSFLAGHPQISLYISLVWGFFVVMDLASSRLWFWDGLWSLGLVLALFVAMIAFQLYPAQVIGEFSTRKAAGADYSLGLSLPLTALPGLVFPYLLGAEPFENHLLGGNSWEMASWVALSAWVVLLLGVFRTGKKPAWVWPWLILGILALILALGAATPIYGLALKAIPGLSMVRAPGRFVFILLFALAVTACLLVDKLPKDSKKIWFTLAAVLGLGGIVLVALSFQGTPPGFLKGPLLQLAEKLGKGGKPPQAMLSDAASLMSLNGFWAISLAAAFGSAGFLLHRGQSPSRAFLLAVLLESAILILPFHTTAPRARFSWPSPPDMEGRVVSLRDRPDMDDLLKLKVQAIEGFDPVILESYRKTLNLFLAKEIPASTNSIDFEEWVDPVFDLLGVKWVLPKVGKWQENSGAFPLVWTKPNWPTRPLDPSHLVAALRPDKSSTATLTWKSKNNLSIRADCGPRPCVLLSSLPLAPGWEFSLNEKSTPPLALFGHFLSLDLPKGKHQIVGHYLPPGMKFLGPLALLGWIISLGLLAGAVKKKK